MRPARASRFPTWPAALWLALLLPFQIELPLVAEPERRPGLADVPAAMKRCYFCHSDTAREYLGFDGGEGHGMTASVGPLEPGPEAGRIANPQSGNAYEILTNSRGTWLAATFPGGGTRVQRLVGRIGAGLFDTSWVGMEVDEITGEETGRLFFAPLESVSGHGLELSPFELGAPAAGLDFALDENCLTCHTDTPLSELPGAAVPSVPESETESASESTTESASESTTENATENATMAVAIFPENALGADAFEHLAAFSCQACHGDGDRHLELMPSPGKDAGLPRLGTLPAAAQRDVCRRCHLQGAARLDLAPGTAPPAPAGPPLAGRVPVLVPARQGKDFRFVGQLERLALSACFQGSPEMTCTTCHDPHRGVAAQGLSSFDAACQQCHEVCSRPADSTVEAMLGTPGRSEAGCVDCHVRRSQPVDLPHVRSADHRVARRIALPEALPYRQLVDPGGPLVLFDDGHDERLAAALSTPAGERWRRGVLAIGLVSVGRGEEALEPFARFPEPGTAAALRANAPSGLVPLETSPLFHQARALALLAAGQPRLARAAWSDALEIAPRSPAARLGRARIALYLGDAESVLRDTQAVIDLYPRAEHPWLLRADLAARLGQPELESSALLAAVRLWPSNADAWQRLARLLEAQGYAAQAAEARERLRHLRPGGGGPVLEHGE